MAKTKLVDIRARYDALRCIDTTARQGISMWPPLAKNVAELINSTTYKPSLNELKLLAAELEEHGPINYKPTTSRSLGANIFQRHTSISNGSGASTEGDGHSGGICNKLFDASTVKSMAALFDTMGSSRTQQPFVRIHHEPYNP